MFCRLHPWTVDFVLPDSIFTHASLLCIVLGVSCPQSTSCSVEVLVYLPCHYKSSWGGWWWWFWVESSFVHSATQSKVMSQTQVFKIDRKQRAETTFVYFKDLGAYVCEMCDYSPSVPLRLCLFSFSLTGRGSADPQVYQFPYKGITQPAAEASVECLLFFFCPFF